MELVYAITEWDADPVVAWTSDPIFILHQGKAIDTGVYCSCAESSPATMNSIKDCLPNKTWIAVRKPITGRENPDKLRV
jgi:hypothetical protein